MVIEVPAFRIDRGLFALAVTLALSACASRQLAEFDPPRLDHPGPEVQLTDVDVLAVSPAMEQFLARYILPYPNSQTKIHLLYQTMLNGGIIGFTYDESVTLTAAEAFETRSGNCVAFANMIIALARQAGLKAHYQEIVKFPEWSMNDDTVLLVKHVNVVVEGPGKDYVLDISGLQFGPEAQRRMVKDDYAKALYLNNLGAGALLDNNLPLAWAYMTKAIAVEPTAIDSWVNLGVVFRRNNQLDDAVAVLERALQVDPYQRSAMNNLYEVYLEQGNQKAADRLQVRVDHYRQDNPYFLLQLSQEALDLDRYDESISLLQRAIKKKDDDHLLYYALAKTQHLSGENNRAEISMSRARELAPQNVQARYARSLDELIAEDKAAQETTRP